MSKEKVHIPDRPYTDPKQYQTSVRVDWKEKHCWQILQMFPIAWVPGMPLKYFHSPMMCIKEIYDNGDVREHQMVEYVQRMRRETAGIEEPVKQYAAPRPWNESAESDEILGNSEGAI